MGYKPKSWPPVANRHRTEAIFTAARIKEIANEASEDVYINADLAAAKLDHIVTLADSIVYTLETAPSDDPVDNNTQRGDTHASA